MKTTMIVVADSVRARIFVWGDDRTEIKEIEDISHPEGRLHDRDMSSDQPGKDSGGHVYDSKNTPKKHQLTEFAKRVSEYLDDARKANKLSKIILLVAPEFLGELRSQFSNEIGKIIVFELPKNIAAQSAAEILKHIPKPSEYKKIG